MLYQEVFEEFNQKGVKYIVAGGIAVVLYGVVRLTVDLDIIVEMSEKNIDKIFSVLGRLGYKPRIPVTLQDFKDEKKREEWIKKRNMKVFSFFHPAKHLNTVDILLTELPAYRKIRKKTFKAEGISIPTISLAQLKKLKEKAARPKDFADLRALKDIEKIRKGGK